MSCIKPQEFSLFLKVGILQHHTIRLTLVDSSQVTKAWKVEFTSQIKLIYRCCLRVLRELVQRLNSLLRVLLDTTLTKIEISCEGEKGLLEVALFLSCCN